MEKLLESRDFLSSSPLLSQQQEKRARLLVCARLRKRQFKNVLPLNIINLKLTIPLTQLKEYSIQKLKIVFLILL